MADINSSTEARKMSDSDFTTYPVMNIDINSESQTDNIGLNRLSMSTMARKIAANRSEN